MTSFLCLVIVPLVNGTKLYPTTPRVLLGLALDMSVQGVPQTPQEERCSRPCKSQSVSLETVPDNRPIVTNRQCQAEEEDQHEVIKPYITFIYLNLYIKKMDTQHAIYSELGQELKATSTITLQDHIDIMYIFTYIQKVFTKSFLILPFIFTSKSISLTSVRSL